MDKEYKRMAIPYNELGIGTFNKKVLNEIKDSGITDILSRYKVKVLKNVFGSGYEGDDIEETVDKAYNAGIINLVETFKSLNK
jgi:hypothetical protein